MNKTILGAIFFMVLISITLGPSILFSAETNPNPPTIFLIPVTSDEESTTYNIVLTGNQDVLNVIELTLSFDPVKTIIDADSISIESPLCRPELTIENTIDAERGIWYVACGNYVPFSGDTVTLGTFSISHPISEYSWLNFGTDTSLYRHDGFGTQVFPTTLPWLHNYHLLFE